MRYKPNLPEAVERMRRLWAMEPPLDRVPCSVRLPAPDPPGGRRPIKDASSLGDLDGYLSWQAERFRLRAEVPDDWIPTVGPRYGHALISALCGSPIRVEAETTWSVPIIEDWHQVDALRLDFENEWGRRFRAELDVMLDWAAGRCAVEVYEVEGISDTMSALRGAERMCTDFHDAPEQAHRFAQKVTDLLIAWGRWNVENVGAQQDVGGGISTGWCLWMPAGSICLAEDATVLFGPELYRRFILEEERRLTKAFTRTLLEVHAEGNHQIPEFGDVEGVSMMAIQNPLRMAPEDRDTVKALLGRKAFRISCKPDEVEKLLAFMGTRGVYLSLSAGSIREARALLGDLERWTARHANAPAPTQA